ncbi:MAG: AAA family ATPase [Desulfobacter postgatei]|uniref:AAA family ATPase n=1 Tax=Desulfobacter postgatei TaxID=2293 RepID=UPI0023F32830|nr:AAA family ATPase [Desulfobacter postgatei]MDD4273397.1 AAA family ATPase [Desulfobacter postgatei]
MIEGAVWVTQSKSNCKFILQKLGDIKTSLPDWLIKGLIEKDTVSVIFGDPESGKSFIAIDMACHIATNKPYHGRTVKSGSVIYIAGEGQNGLKRRFDAWAIRHKKSLDNAPIYLSLQPAAMADTERVLIVKQAIDEVSINEGAPPSLIVIDTLTRNFGPGDQNNSRDMVAFISGVDVIRAEYRAALVIVHHSGHGDKSRGKGAIDLKGAIDTEYRAEKDELGTIRVTCTKMKDHQKTNPFALKFRTVELGTFDDEGEPVTSSILDPVDYTPPEQNGPKNLGKWQTVCQGILISLFDEKRRNLEKGNYDPNQAKILISDVKQEAISHGLNPKNWNRYFNHLSNLDEFIVNQPYFELHPQNSSNNLKEEK